MGHFERCRVVILSDAEWLFWRGFSVRTEGFYAGGSEVFHSVISGYFHSAITEENKSAINRG